jgi:Zn ribbon nucleic-acid-binding protein
MESQKYERNISLLCPTCGNTQFKIEKGVDETIEIVKCASCGREITKDELIQANSENVFEHKQEMGSQVIEDAAKDMKESLKRIFRGNKNIEIK